MKVNNVFKNFLNKKQRESFIQLSCMVGYLKEEILGTWKLDSQSTRELKTSVTYVLKFMDRVYKALDPDQKSRIFYDADNTQIICIPKHEKHIEESIVLARQQKELCQVDRWLLEYIAEKALGNCDPCRETNCQNCKLRKAFIELNIPPLDEDQHPDCPYKKVTT